MDVRHPDSDLTKADYEVLAAFRQALRNFAAFSETAARRQGLTPQQHQALLAIKGAPGRSTLSVGELASALRVRPHTAVELVDRLAQLDLVERKPDGSDHRRVQLVLTARAERLMQALAAAHLSELSSIRPALADLISLFEDRV